jgi:hypothetical protein
MKANRALINKTITHLEKLKEESYKLYILCFNNGRKDTQDPSFWLLNQDVMRKSWDDHKSQFDNLPEETKNKMLNDNFAKYMNFMYNSYPPDFGKQVYKKCEESSVTGSKKNIKYESALIYLNLTNK